MRSAIFSGLVFAGSNATLHGRFAALPGSEHMLETLRGWAVVVFFISLVWELIQVRSKVPVEPRGRQIASAFKVFALFSCFLMFVVFARAENRIPLISTLLTALGVSLAPVAAVMALEFPDLRPRAAAAAGLVAGCLISFVGINALVVKPAKPGFIRTKQPVRSNEPLRWNGTERA